MANTGYLDSDGTDLINAYCKNSASTFTGLNVFNNGSTSGLICCNQAMFFGSTSVTYTSTNVPNCIISQGLNSVITFTLPTTGVPNGFILHFRQNNGIGITYQFTQNIYSISNALITSLYVRVTFILIHYNSNWYVYYAR